jgi:AcrR family transcriptional regulator
LCPQTKSGIQTQIKTVCARIQFMPSQPTKPSKVIADAPALNMMAVRSKAWNLWRSKGFQEVSLEEIALAAGENPASLGQHFKDKNDLLLTLYNTAFESLVKHSFQSVESLDFENAVVKIIKGFLGFYAQDRALARQYFSAFYALNHEEKKLQTFEIIRDYILGFKKLVLLSQQRDLFDTGISATDVARVIFNIYQTMLTSFLYGSVSAEQAAEKWFRPLLKVVIHGLAKTQTPES